MPTRRQGKGRAMREFGLVHAWLSCCAGVCLIVGACSSGEGDGRSAGSGGMEAGAGSAHGGRAGGGAAGEGTGGTGAAGSSGHAGGGAGGGGQGGACTEEVTGGLVQLTLAEYCRRDHDCPRTLE